MLRLYHKKINLLYVQHNFHGGKIGKTNKSKSFAISSINKYLIFSYLFFSFFIMGLRVYDFLSFKENYVFFF